MKTDVRAGAARVLVQVISDGRSLSDVLPAAAQQLADPRQRALLQELCYGTLRWYYRLDALLQRLLKKPLKQRDADVRCVLLVGLYQLDQLAMPQRVAVNETVQATHALNKQWASGLVNGVLRNYQRQAAELEAGVAAEFVSGYAHPAWLIEQLQFDWPNDWEQILTANNARPPFSLRVNRQRITRTEYLETLAGQSLDANLLEYTSSGVQLDKPVPVDVLPGFSAGYVSVQDGAAQLAAGLLDLHPGQRVLDACAAPGGKTAHILESQPDLAMVTAVDIEPRRLARIEENLSRLSLHACQIAGDVAAPSAWWDGKRYDRILLDVPCSASGVIRRHPDIKLLRKPGDITKLVSAQSRLLQAIWPLLSSGGMLLYCTCSVLAVENSQQIAAFLETQEDAAEVKIEAVWGRECQHGRQIFPGENEMDGFYFACLTRLN
jgi:16S rRNA (cytosine967-C5)-methyltransferase